MIKISDMLDNPFELFTPHPVRLLADSIYETRLTTFLIPLPTCLLAELRTHRLLHWGDDEDFSVNANSDRAIPIDKRITMTIEHPYLPIPSKANKGMTGVEDMTREEGKHLRGLYYSALTEAVVQANRLKDAGGSKQMVNRILMPYAWSSVVVSGGEEAWDCFFRLRLGKDVEPNFRFISRLVKTLTSLSTPTQLREGDWHIPFTEEINLLDKTFPLSTEECILVSASCTARTSYNIVREESMEKHKERANRCWAELHTSVFEHQARAEKGTKHTGNLGRGWSQARKLIEGGLLNVGT